MRAASAKAEVVAEKESSSAREKEEEEVDEEVSRRGNAISSFPRAPRSLLSAFGRERRLDGSQKGKEKKKNLLIIVSVARADNSRARRGEGVRGDFDAPAKVTLSCFDLRRPIRRHLERLLLQRWIWSTRPGFDLRDAASSKRGRRKTNLGIPPT